MAVGGPIAFILGPVFYILTSVLSLGTFKVGCCWARAAGGLPLALVAARRAPWQAPLRQARPPCGTLQQGGLLSPTTTTGQVVYTALARLAYQKQGGPFCENVHPTLRNHVQFLEVRASATHTGQAYASVELNDGALSGGRHSRHRTSAAGTALIPHRPPCLPPHPPLPFRQSIFGQPATFTPSVTHVLLVAIMLVLIVQLDGRRR